MPSLAPVVVLKTLTFLREPSMYSVKCTTCAVVVASESKLRSSNPASHETSIKFALSLVRDIQLIKDPCL